MRVTELVKQVVDEGMPREQAVRHIVRLVGRDPELIREWWEQYGARSVEHALLSLARNGNGHGLGPQRRGSSPALPKSWRDRLRENPALALDLELPVRGEMLKVRDLTANHVQWIEDQYTGLAQIATARAERWRRVRKRMEWGETIGQAIEAKRVKVSDVVATGFEPLELGT